MASANSAAAEEREIAMTREFDAPRQLVWKAWTDPNHVSQWWGPIGFTTTTKQFEFRPGGQWLHTMHGPDGTDYPNEVTFKVIDEPNRIEYSHESCPLFYTTVLFEQIGAKTKLSMQMLFRSSDERNETAEKYGAIEGLKQTLSRLEEFVSRSRQDI